MVLMMLLASLAATPSQAQGPPGVHYQHAGILSPGAIGRQQLARGGPLPGYVQPVEIRAPQGALVSLALDGGFESPRPTPRTIGMTIAPVYRLKVTNLPRREGDEVFPTIELIDRVYPPVGMETQFPIPVHLTQEELELALAGHFVTRVIYLEHPDRALAHADERDEQRWFQLRSDEDPLVAADRLGRPVAILRLGGRVPGEEGPDADFLFHSPPWVPLIGPAEMAQSRRSIQPPSQAHAGDAAGHAARVGNAAAYVGDAATHAARASAHATDAAKTRQSSTAFAAD